MSEHWKTIHSRDHSIIINMIEPGSSVLDIGCSQGEMMLSLKEEKACHVQGLEIDFDSIATCTRKGLPIIYHNIEDGLPEIPDNFYDYVILSRTLQVLEQPSKVLQEVLRIGKKAIVSFPNFAYFEMRLYLLKNGLMPKSKSLPFEWYDTPNIHGVTIRDFQQYCQTHEITIERAIFSSVHNPNRFFQFIGKRIPNLFAQYGIYLLEK